jgi:site-specific DNA recombinase
MRKTAASYLRSTKDRSDVSLDSQRRELRELAAREQIEIVAEYSDAVESAKSENRPGFQRLLTDLRSPTRGWNILLATDTSRISRRTYFAHVMRHECEKRGVDVRYSKLPQDLDPITEVIVHSTLTAMDEVHSLMSRQKGLAGMAENVRAGWRAGGRAPYGYALEKVGTGTQRDGAEVTKTRLVRDKSASAVARYLQERAAGATRRIAMDASAVNKAASTLIGIEWNALTYAGATIWNVHAEQLPDGGYKGGHKRRPREEWVIQRDTHEALITWEQAETIVHRLENSDRGKAVSAGKTGNSAYLLTGLLTSPQGGKWWGHRQRKQTYYRHVDANGKNKHVLTNHVDEAVIEKIARDMNSDEFVKALAANARQQTNADDPAQELRTEVVRLNEQISKTMDLATSLDDPAPALRKINELERTRKEAAEQVNALEREHSAQEALRQVTPDGIRKALDTLWKDTRELDTPQMKAALKAFVQAVELNPETLEAKVFYRVSADRCVRMASPRGFEPLLPP